MFAPLVVAVLTSAWVVGAQETGNDAYHPHAAFVFVRTGERTPLIQPGPLVLTAVGADQMYTLGQNFRTRYITGSTPDGLGQEHIAGISPNTLNNDQILVQTLDTGYLLSSAQAFMQGLYPPYTFANGTGDSTNLPPDGRTVNYPLNGYQYANIMSTGPQDPDSISVSGAQNCPSAQKAALMYFTTDNFMETQAANQDFYASLDMDWFEGYLEKDELDYANAVPIADYLTYQYVHNSSIYRMLANDSTLYGVYDKVRYLADEEAWYLYGNTSTSGTDDDNNRAISGKTLASAVLGQLQKYIIDQTSGGDTANQSYPLTFFFGEQDPMISLISLMMTDYRDDNFRSIPPFGSAMVFELFSTGDNADFPMSEDALWVRFYFHNGTSYENNQMIAYPTFGNGPSKTDMLWADFQDMFSRIMMDTLTDWCGTCESSTLFCWGVDNTNITLAAPAPKDKVSPTIAGVIGAMVALAVAGLLFALAMLVGGVRLHRQPRSRKAELGGFKGSAKLASDPDLSLAKNGAPPAGIVSFGDGDHKKGHERVGSWELGQKEFGPSSGRVSDESRRESFDAIDAVASKPVEPHERV